MRLEARLRAFAAFARQRSFSAAAAELRISQPAVSKHIAELEDALGLKLVERIRRDGTLTSPGDFLANYVLRAEALLVQAALGAAQFRESGAGSVALAASSLTGTYLLPELIADFQHSHPGVRVSLQTGSALHAIEQLRSHRAELGFVAGVVSAPEIETEPVLEYEVVIVGRPALVPSRPSRNNLEKLTWISREEGSATRVSSDAGLAQLGIAPGRRLMLPSNEALVHALKSGYGIAAISRYVVAAELKAGSLAVIRVRGWHVRNVVSVLRVRDATLTPSATGLPDLRARTACRNGSPASTLTKQCGLARELLVLDPVRDAGNLRQPPHLVGLVVLEVALEPFDMAVALEGEHVGRDAVEEPAVVADDDGAAGEILQRLFERAQRIDVEIVGRLVEQQHVGAGLEHLGEMHAVALAARERADLLLLVGALEVERRAHSRASSPRACRA